MARRQVVPVDDADADTLRAEKERRTGTAVPGAAAAKLRRIHSDTA